MKQAKIKPTGAAKARLTVALNDLEAALNGDWKPLVEAYRAKPDAKLAKAPLFARIVAIARRLA